MARKYSVEIDISGYEAPEDEGCWLGYGTLTAEGSSLQDCLDSAQVDLIDQDGGEFDVRPADSVRFQRLVLEAFLEAYPDYCAGPEDDDALLEYRSEQDAEARALNKENGRG